MAILQCAPNLTGEFTSDPLAQTAMADNVIQHLATVHVLEDHIIVVLMDDHFSHAADIRVVKKHGKGGFAKSPNLLRCVPRSLTRGGIVGAIPIHLRWRIRVNTRKYLDGELEVQRVDEYIN